MSSGGQSRLEQFRARQGKRVASVVPNWTARKELAHAIKAMSGALERTVGIEDEMRWERQMKSLVDLVESAKDI